MLFCLSLGDCLTFGIFLHDVEKINVQNCQKKGQGICFTNKSTTSADLPDMSIELSFLAYLEVYSMDCLCTSFVLPNFVFTARVEMFQQFVCFWIGFSCLNLRITSSVNHLFDCCIINIIVVQTFYAFVDASVKLFLVQ